MLPRIPVLAAVLLVTSAAGAHAQVRASERATLSQTIDGTTITIDYARPRIRGRGQAFGDVAKIGDHRWTPGANWASTITSNRPFRLNGHDVPEGTWSMWIDLEPDAWTMILDPADSLFHTNPPKDSDAQIRFDVERREGGPFFESMIFYVPETRLDGFDMRLAWGTTEIPFDVEVESTFQKVVAEEDARPLLGSYAMEIVSPGRSARGSSPPFDLTWEDGHLLAHSVWPGSNWPMDGWLLPLGEGFYRMGWVQDGELWEIIADYTYEVVREDGRIAGFDVRGTDDALWARIRRDGVN